MTEYNDKVELQRQILLAEEHVDTVINIHAHSMTSMWYETDETIKDAVSIPIQALTSRLDDYELDISETDEQENKFKKANTIDVIFVLKDKFRGSQASDNMKYAVIKPIQIGISDENYYSVKSGVKEGDLIVIGGYRLISKDLKHGDLVSTNDEIENYILQ